MGEVGTPESKRNVRYQALKGKKEKKLKSSSCVMSTVELHGYISGFKTRQPFEAASNRALERDVEKANGRESKQKMTFHFRGKCKFMRKILLDATSFPAFPAFLFSLLTSSLFLL